MTGVRGSGVVLIGPRAEARPRGEQETKRAAGSSAVQPPLDRLGRFCVNPFAERMQQEQVRLLRGATAGPGTISSQVASPFALPPPRPRKAMLSSWSRCAARIRAQDVLRVAAPR